MPADLNDYFNKNKKNGGNENGGFSFKGPNLQNFGGFKFGGFFYFLIAIIALFIIAKPFATIQSGEVGIKSNLGKYDPTPLGAGIHFFVPFIQDIFVIDTRVRIINYTSNEDMATSRASGGSIGGIIRKNSLSVLDSRNLPVSVDITVQYKLNESTAPATIAEWGLLWEDKIIDPRVKDVVRSVIGNYPAEELPTKREEIAKAIDQGIRSNIDALSNSPVELRAVQLREIILPPKIKEQIERVQIAKQEAERTKYEVERANQEALKKAALAKGNADAVKIEAQGKADAVKIEADAQAYANTEIAKSLNQNLLNLKQIETQAKFNEALRENKDAQIFLTPGGAVPNIWVDTKNKPQQSAISEQ
ncbi:SPFH domain-containing protein [Campylobacter sp. VBCF_01 NA2]|uniref:SPFH domain-containing protein n=1 Tax=Campylobacter sp. VBCF_01 NA2 TaxID=2983836 RepID=UPI0022EA0F6D|nr:SPFH domain-containing protein [Campylobacter sp. VBCF_01 NA2]WBR54345.1 SPFH domain-containing protein [Campylobacter sp. VBCF_01 NA2]